MTGRITRTTQPRMLHIENASLSAREFEELLHQDLHLEALVLAGAMLGDEIGPIASRLGACEYLQLCRLPISNAFFDDWPLLPSLKSLAIASCTVSSPALHFLPKSSTIVSLNIRACPMSDSIAEFINDSRLKYLYLEDMPLSDAFLGALDTSRALLSLSLGGTQVSDASIDRIAEFPSLRVLSLSGTRVTDAALAVLLKLSQIRDLRLAETPVTVSTVEVLLGGLSLDVLDIRQTSVAAADCARLQSKYGRTLISY